MHLHQITGKSVIASLKEQFVCVSQTYEPCWYSAAIGVAVFLIANPIVCGINPKDRATLWCN